MLVPRNPRDDDPIWPALEATLRGVGDFSVVKAGAVVPHPGITWTAQDAARFVQALKIHPLRFVGARHGQPLAPHFAVAVDDDAGAADLVELVTMRFRGDGDGPAGRDLIHDLGVVAACVSSSRPALSTLRTPLRMPHDVIELLDGVHLVDGRLHLDLRAC